MADTTANPATLDDVLDAINRANAEGLDPAGVAAFLSISVSMVHRMNRDGLLPAPAELSDRLPRWSRTELKAWLLAGSPSRIRWQSIRDVSLRKAG